MSGLNHKLMALLAGALLASVPCSACGVAPEPSDDPASIDDSVDDTEETATAESALGTPCAYGYDACVGNDVVRYTCNGSRVVPWAQCTVIACRRSHTVVRCGERGQQCVGDRASSLPVGRARNARCASPR